MQFPLLPFFFAMLAVISATVLPVNFNKDSLHLVTRDEDAITLNLQGVANFSLLYDADSNRCGSAPMAVVFNQLTDTKFTPACQAFYDYMTLIPNSLIPNSSLKYSTRGVSLVYVCTSKKQPPTLPADMGVADIKIIIYGPKAFPIQPFSRQIFTTLTVTNAKDDPVTNFTLPASFDFGPVTQSDGSSKLALTSLHCR